MKLNPRQGLSYGLMGLPLAFVALPLYIVLPNHYAREFGVPLATLGSLLLGARLFDAVTDPLLGRFSDRLFARSCRAVLAWSGGAAALLALGFAGLFFPPTHEPAGLLIWAGLMLMLTYAAFSGLSVAHQSWGAMLGNMDNPPGPDAEAQRSGVVAWREGAGLVGVLLASVVPVLLGLGVTVMLFVAALLAGWLAWRSSPWPGVRNGPSGGGLWLPWGQPAFRRLLAVFVLNGIASAVPATLVLFFIQDKLQASQGWAPVFLGSYFLCAAVSIPLWLKLVVRIGLPRSWLAGMALSMAVFAWAATVGAGDLLAFGAICALSGLALGTDLTLPGAMLAGVIQNGGNTGRAEGSYFGWWNFATKLNLALAAGLALPLLGLYGYTPGARDPAALQALVVAYCVLPCALKLAAAATLYTLTIRKPAP
jgi:Na+/melibiose symporter-like transporter